MRRMMVGMLGLGAMVLSLGGCSRAVPVADVSGQHFTAAQDRDDKDARDEKDVKDEKDARDDATAFELPRDRTGQLLGQVLPPRTQQGTLNRPNRPAPPTVPAPKFVEPAPALPMGTALVSRAPAPRKGELRPRLVIDESFEGSLDAPAVPLPPSFAAEKLTAVPAEDVSIPPPLPITAQPTIDRVSADDFTTEASTEAALAAPLPRRTSPAPFVKGGVPEPFENRKPLTTKSPDEETSPVVDGPALPK